MESRRWIILGVASLIVVGGIVWLAARQGGVVPSPARDESAQPSAGAPSVLPTRRDAPANITVPEPGQSPQRSDVAVPTISAPGAPGVEDRRFRSFDVSAQGGRYQPSTIIVRAGDTVHINFKALDATYDIAFPDFGLRQTARAGETRILEFQAVYDGQFSFRCESVCPKGAMQGTLIVAKE